MNRHEKHAESASKHAPAEFTMPFGLDMTGLMYQPAFAPMAQVNGRLYAGLVELNKEWSSFVNRRLQNDFSLPQQFGACKTPQDVFKVYSDFYRQAFEDYQAEFAKLTKMDRASQPKSLRRCRCRITGPSDPRLPRQLEVSAAAGSQEFWSARILSRCVRHGCGRRSPPHRLYSLCDRDELCFRRRCQRRDRGRQPAH